MSGQTLPFNNNNSKQEKDIKYKKMDTETTSPATSELYNSCAVHHVDATTAHSSGATILEAALCHEGAKMCNSSIVYEEAYEQVHMEPDEYSHVTIIITDTSDDAKSGGVSVGGADTHVAMDATPPPLDPDYIARCLEQCLKLASGEAADVCCFVCPETCASFVGLREHLKQAHNLSHSVTQPLSLPSEYITEMAKEIKKLECTCTEFVCATCEVTHVRLLSLVQHVLLDHPTRYGKFPFFSQQQGRNRLEKCQRCTVLDKLCHVDYNLFVKVLLDCVECSDKDSKTLLLSWPLAHCSEPCEWCAEEGREGREGRGEEQAGSKPGTHGKEREVICYRIKRNISSKYSQKKSMSSFKCICPLIKCPECPKTVANYADLRKHVRQSNHGSWLDLRLIWEKYKIIKENCPVCPKHFYHSYILCPHCPHLALESERDAQSHMDSQHNAQARDKMHAECTCPHHFTCMTCHASFPTPQALHRHMGQTQHQTPGNLAAIPAMIEESMKGRQECPRCSLRDPCDAPSTREKQECSCRWAECCTCKTSFRRVSALLEHTHRAKHPMSAKDIRKEREKVAGSVVTCQRCCIEANKYCVLCHRKENFMYTHLKTCHQDVQIMLLKDDCGNLLEEHHTEGWEGGRLARYECSVCCTCFPRFNELWCHVCRQHPRRYFTLACLDLSRDVWQVKDFVAHEKLMVLNVVDKALQS